MKTAISFIAATALLFCVEARAQVASGAPYTIEQSAVTTGGGTSADAGNAYKIESAIGQPLAGNTSANASFKAQTGFFTPSPFGTTAATVKISGRVLTSEGRGIRNVWVTMTSGNGLLRTAVSSSFGYFTFENVPVGEAYIFTVSAKRYQFSEGVQVFSVYEDVNDINFIADAQP
jgi:hypothetical protein